MSNPFMARRAVPSVTTDRIAEAINAACSGETTACGASVRELEPSSIQRPWGIFPPAAMVAATRAILKGVTSTGPWP